MILNGKAREDFYNYLFENIKEQCFGDLQDVYDYFNYLPLSCKNVLVIDWFDSIDFHCNAIRYNKEYWQPICVYVMHEKFKTRQEASAKAIEKANEIYNDRPI